MARQVPLHPDFMNRSKVKRNYGERPGFGRLILTHTDGELQDLIMWGQLSEKVRETLNGVVFYDQAAMPMSDECFIIALDNSWPFAPVNPP